MECHLPGGEGAGASVGGGAVPTRYSWARFYAQHLLRNQTLGEGWTLFFSGVGQGERCWAGVGIVTSSWLSTAMLEFSLGNERVVSLRLHVAGRKTVCLFVHMC